MRQHARALKINEIKASIIAETVFSEGSYEIDFVDASLSIEIIDDCMLIMLQPTVWWASYPDGGADTMGAIYDEDLNHYEKRIRLVDYSDRLFMRYYNRAIKYHMKRTREETEKPWEDQHVRKQGC